MRRLENDKSEADRQLERAQQSLKEHTEKLNLQVKKI